MIRRRTKSADAHPNGESLTVLQPAAGTRHRSFEIAFMMFLHTAISLVDVASDS